MLNQEEENNSSQSRCQTGWEHWATQPWQAGAGDVMFSGGKTPIFVL